MSLPKWYITVDEQMGRIPKRKEFKWEQEIREYCALEKQQVGCLIELLIKLKTVPQPERLRWMRWWCVATNKCKYYRGSREAPVRISAKERIPISEIPTERRVIPTGKSSPHPEVEKLYSEGLSPSEISERTGLSSSQIRYCLKRVGLI